MNAPKFSIKDVLPYERSVPFRLPFKFGNTIVEKAQEAVVQVIIETEDGRIGEGYGAELMVPKWFDKREDISVAENVHDLRHSIMNGRRQYLDLGKCTAFGFSSGFVVPSKNGLMDRQVLY